MQCAEASAPYMPPPSESLTGQLTQVAERYRRMLESNPNEPEALVGMSLVALASRQPEAAVQMAEAAVGVAPRMGTAWVTLGQALRAASRSLEAEQAYANAIELDSLNTLARMGLGELKIATDRAEEALLEFELVLKRDPRLITAQLGAGHALASLSRFEEALARYEKALQLDPKQAEAEFSAGYSLMRMGRRSEAEKRYRRAVALRPDFAAAWMNLGCLLRDLGRDLYAKAALVRSLELRPDLVSGWINLALLERDFGNYERAESHLRKAFELNPDQVETQIAWAQFRAAQKDVAGAWGWLRWALARNPNHDEAVNCWGILLHNEGRFAEAVQVFERAEELGNKPATSNRGNALLDMGDLEGALKAHARAAELDPHNPGAHYNLALTQLRVGEWEKGWAGYEARWNFREIHRRPRVFEQPRWTGEALNGQRVLLYAEQGLGDTIQFCRYADLVAGHGGFPVLQVQDAAEPLLRSLRVVQQGRAELAILGGRLPKFDLECPLMSMPAIFGTTVETTPWPGPYLSAQPEEAVRKRQQFPTRQGSKLRVGITWAGNPRYKADHLRSTTLDTFLPLLQLPGVTWVSLQKGTPTEQLAALPAEIDVIDGSSQDRDLAEAAALIETLDLVISTDTCVPHLAAAMGKPVWVLLPHLADWRWMQETETTPWYPSMRLIRQTSPGDWPSVILKARDLLKDLDERSA